MVPARSGIDAMVARGDEPSAPGCWPTRGSIPTGRDCARRCAPWARHARDARAAPEARADDVHYPGTYVAGCARPPGHGGVGPVVNEDIVNVPNWLPLTFRIGDGDWFDSSAGSTFSITGRSSTFAAGCSPVSWPRPGGRIRAVQRRLVDMAHPHVAALEITIVGENWSGPIELRSALDGTVTNSGVARYRGLRGDHLVPVDQSDPGGGVICLQVQSGPASSSPPALARIRLDGRPVSTPPGDRGTGIRRPELASRAYQGEALTVEEGGPPHAATRRSRRPVWPPGRRSTTWATSPSCWNPRARDPAVGALRPATRRPASGRAGPPGPHLPPAADGVAQHHRSRLWRSGPGLARRGLPGACLLGRAFYLPLAQPAAPGADPLDAPTVPAGSGPAARREGRGHDVPLAERQRRPGGDPDAASQPPPGRWLADNSRCSGTSTSPSPTTRAGATTRSPRDVEFLRFRGRR